MSSEIDVILKIIGEAVSGINRSHCRIASAHRQLFSLPALLHGRFLEHLETDTLQLFAHAFKQKCQKVYKGVIRCKNSV